MSSLHSSIAKVNKKYSVHTISVLAALLVAYENKDFEFIMEMINFQGMGDDDFTDIFEFCRRANLTAVEINKIYDQLNNQLTENRYRTFIDIARQHADSVLHVLRNDIQNKERIKLWNNVYHTFNTYDVHFEIMKYLESLRQILGHTPIDTGIFMLCDMCFGSDNNLYFEYLGLLMEKNNDDNYKGFHPTCLRKALSYNNEPIIRDQLNRALQSIGPNNTGTQLQSIIYDCFTQMLRYMTLVFTDENINNMIFVDIHNNTYHSTELLQILMAYIRADKDGKHIEQINCIVKKLKQRYSSNKYEWERIVRDLERNNEKYHDKLER